MSAHPISPAQNKKIDNLINVLNYNIKVIHEEMQAPLYNKKDILSLTHQLSEIIDDFIILASNILKSDIDKKIELPVIIAIGGYGRGELAPFSDIDLLFLSDEPLTLAAKKFIKDLNNILWKAKLKLGYSVRTIDDCNTAIHDDIHFLTSLFEKRYLWGNKSPHKALQKNLAEYQRTAGAGAFITAKLAERDARHRKMGDTRYALEPNVKESKGALRDIQTLMWMAHALFGVSTPEGLVKKDILTRGEAETLRKAQSFFWEVRCRMHLMSERADDRLTFDMQPGIAKQMGYRDAEPHVRAERFMKQYFMMANETGHLTRILCADLEARALAVGGTAGTRKLAMDDDIEGFPTLHNRLTVGSSTLFKNDPSKVIQLFRVSQTSGHDIHPDALRYMKPALKHLPESKSAYPLFLDILQSDKGAEKTLRHMNEAGVLSALIPDFANIHAHMQYDMYHVFTADEHTIRAIGMMHSIENGDLVDKAPLASELFAKIKSRRVLYTAMFLHDIAKGTGGKHSEKGGEIARKICPLLGLEAEETETVAWLVEQHLIMTMTAFKRDLNDPKTILNFVDVVQSPERLKLLTILTAADIMAVGPDRWNNWKSGLLDELYRKSRALMSGTSSEDDEDTTIVAMQKKLRRLIGDNKEDFRYLTDHTPKYFWTSFGAEDLSRYVNYLHHRESTLIKITPMAEHDFTEVFIFTPDQKGLFATLSGAMAASGASIADARIFTLSDGMALDVFQVQNLNGNVYENVKYLEKTIKAALAGNIDIDTEILQRQKDVLKKTRLFKVASRVIIDNDASSSHTMIEVNGKDRPGFLHDVTAALTYCGLQIMAAKVTTFGSRAVDVFYVKDSFGLKVLHAEKLATIEKNLKLTLDKNL